MEDAPTNRDTLKEQAWNRLTLAAGGLILTGAGITMMFEGRPIEGSAAAGLAGAFSIMYTKLGIQELREARALDTVD